MTILSGPANYESSVPFVIIGAGACGLIASLAARTAGTEVLVLERDRVPTGSTALSSGYIPAAGTSWQRAKGIEDTPQRLASDIQRKAKNRADKKIVTAVTTAAASTLDWLSDTYQIPFVLLDSFLYPGHSTYRMHAHPDKTGEALINSLCAAAALNGVDIVTEAHVTAVFADENQQVTGVRFERPDGVVEEIGCNALLLACSGFAGNREMVVRYIPEIANARYFGHPGNVGDAVIWGELLGGETADMTAYQGHGSVAEPHGVLITWSLMMEGGIQVNCLGQRFSNEHGGYSEQAQLVLAQPGAFAWNIFDDRLHEFATEFDDYRRADDAGAIRRFDNLSLLASGTVLPESTLEETLRDCKRYAAGIGVDPFGRDFSANPPLKPPWRAVKVAPYLFHTQGGLRIDERARVLRRSSFEPLPNLLAGGGAARGISGNAVWGYLSGNGLLTAVSLGRIAGQTAIEMVGT